MARLILENAVVVNEGLSFNGGILVDDGIIADIFDYEKPCDRERESALLLSGCPSLDMEGKYLAPGVIDSHVHFREPGATHKGSIASESAAAVMGGVTSYLDMPNNNPPAVSAASLRDKADIASRDSMANYGFYLGGSDFNIDEVAAADTSGACAVKLFLGTSTGSLCVKSPVALRRIFESSPLLIAAHCEDNDIIASNLARIKAQYGGDIPIALHPAIRSAAACLASTQKAVALALETGARLHVLHVSTAREVEFLAGVMAATDRITAETCVQYLWFDDSDYGRYGAQIKCNPAIKSAADRSALREAVRCGVIRTVSTDHAPHLLSEKAGGCLKAASGIPLVQYSLQMMLDMAAAGEFTIPMVIEKMCHAPARLFGIDRRGFIRKGYFADLVVFDTAAPCDVPPASHCGWSPVTRFSSSILYTFVNGVPVFAGGRLAQDAPRGRKLNYTNH